MMMTMMICDDGLMYQSSQYQASLNISFRRIYTQLFCQGLCLSLCEGISSDSQVGEAQSKVQHSLDEKDGTSGATSTSTKFLVLYIHIISLVGHIWSFRHDDWGPPDSYVLNTSG